MDDWITALLGCRERGEAAMLVTVAAARGSVPREPGTRMVVTAAGQHGTIGGGHLELRAIAIARDLLADGGAGALRRFPLGASLGQCCGGLVNLMFEAVPPEASQAPWLDQVQALRARGEPCVLVSAAGRPAGAGALVVSAAGSHGSLGVVAGPSSLDAAAGDRARRLLAQAQATALEPLAGDGTLFLFDPVRPPDLEVMLFGAGHVARALVPILASLGSRIHWVDERADAFPPAPPPGDLRILVSDDPVAEVTTAPPACCFLVMTHSHALDEALAQAILARGDFRWFGLIGSLTKRRRFEQRLSARGIEPGRIARMTCPIGIDGIDDKSPAAIAVAVAAQLLRERSRGFGTRARDAAVTRSGGRRDGRLATLGVVP